MRTSRLRLCSAALALVTVFCSSLAAQKAVPDPFAAEPFVAERSDVLYAMNADGTGTMQKTVVVKIQSESALRQLGIVGMGFAANSQRVEFQYVRARRPDGTVTETPVSGVMEQPIPATVQAPFYSDLKVAQLPVKNLQVGDTLEWQARVVLTKAEAENEFWAVESFVTEGSVVREQSVELRAPAAKAVTVWTNPSLGIKVKESADGDRKVYRWEWQQLKPTVGAEADAAKEARKKHVLSAEEELDEERGKLPSVAWTTFPSWAAVGEWYRGLALSRMTPDDEIKAKVAELTAGKTTDEEKVRAIYAYVSTQVRYIGVAFGVGRYQPHQAVEVLHNQYGDCKDKATLLSAMLTAAGIQSDEALIGAGVRFNQAVPSPAAFNHLITHAKLKGQDVWLDSTEEVAPYRMMYAALRDRDALVVPATGAPFLEKTPKMPPFDSVQTWTAKGSLDANGISDSEITLTERGDDELMVRAAIRTVSPAQYDEMTQAMLGALGYGGKSSKSEFSRPDELSEPFKMSFAYHREKGGDWDNLRIIPQLAPVPLPTVDEKEPPVQAIRLGTPRTEVSTAEMKLPKGWTAELPEAVHQKSAFVTYDQTYRFENGTLYAERKIVVLEDKVPAKDWRTYKKFADAVDLGKENYVQLRRASGDAAPATTALSGTKDEQIQQLYDQLDSAYKYGETNRMEALLKQMKDIDPKTPRLMAWQAALENLRRNWDLSIEDNRKELGLYPSEYDRYEAIVWAQMQKKDHTGAEATLREWSKADETDPQPLLELSQLSLLDAQPAAAVDAAKQALARAPDGAAKHDQALLLLGNAQMKAGQKEEAGRTLKDLLASTDNPMMMNDAAFELADAGQELPLDEAKERAAIDKLTTESQSWTLDESMQTLRGKTSLLIASWDTMGWILFREGKSQEAKSYIEAAWSNTPKPDLKDHLDQVNAALGAKPATVPKVAKADVTVTAVAIGQQDRTFPLGPANGRHGVAEYRLLLAHGKVERMEPSAQKTIDGAEAMVKSVDMRKLFPEGSEAKLVRAGMVNCFAEKCMLVLEP